MLLPDWLPTTTLLASLAVLLPGAASAALHTRHPRVAAVLKMTAASAYLAVALRGGLPQTPFASALVAGMVLCWLGDLLLIPEGNGAAFLAGLGSFLLGHVAYAAAFLLAGVAWAWAGGAGLPVVVFAGVILLWLWRADPPRAMRGPVVAYVVAISAMVALAWGCAGAGGSARLPAGAVVFMASDVFVARERFVTPSPWNTRLGLPLYFLAQLLLALSV